MKTSNLISAALVALGIVAQASAQTPVVYLTGSTDFRTAVFDTLSSTLGRGSGGVFDASRAAMGFLMHVLPSNSRIMATAPPAAPTTWSSSAISPARRFGLIVRGAVR